jgi:protein-glutamine gamma-glutamyltransferase
MHVIEISGSNLEDVQQLPLSAFEKEIVKAKDKSPYTYSYDSLEALKFELNMRSNILNAAVALFDSGVQFAPFQKSRCNQKYWTRTPSGNFHMNKGVLPAEAIRDIYQQGHRYAFECSTAIMIVFAKAILDSIGDEAFNTYFKDMTIGDWGANNKLPLVLNEHDAQAYPGDSVYFENPDFDPSMPFWQGENAIMLGKGLYYGHGIGIKSAKNIISELNEKRKEDSTTSAFLLELVLHPNFEQLRRIANGGDGVVARIGAHTYMCV